MNYVIVTGSSKGLGEAIVKQLIERKDTTILCVARTNNKQLVELAIESQVSYEFFPFDLNHLQGIQELMQSIFSKIRLSDSHSLHLINNAGLLNPIKPIDRAQPEEIIANVNVNLLAPIIITSEFIKQTKDLICDKRVINISSGAGKRPIYGWSCYGASKAGLDLFSQNAATDQVGTTHPVQICSFGPGIMDTAMQEQIRSTDKTDFINVETFQAYKKEGQLLSPNTVADVIIRLLINQSFPDGQVVNVGNYLN